MWHFEIQVQRFVTNTTNLLSKCDTLKKLQKNPNNQIHIFVINITWTKMQMWDLKKTGWNICYKYNEP